ncbi:MAG: hypothetical protein LBU32_21215 [Clostridiales bacterium]|nr:hypothetical protein [Clostridiales bacterium]
MSRETAIEGHRIGKSTSEHFVSQGIHYLSDYDHAVGMLASVNNERSWLTAEVDFLEYLDCGIRLWMRE